LQIVWLISVSAKENVTTEPRRQQILNLLEEAGTLNVNELTDRFQVSLVTIRNDLDDLAEAAGARLCIVDVAEANLDREAAGPNGEQTPSRNKAEAL
jgi:hypothetical protein